LEIILIAPIHFQFSFSSLLRIKQIKIVNSQNPNSPYENDLKFQCYQNSEPRRKKQKILVSESGKIQFTAYNYGEESGISPLLHYAVGFQVGKEILLYDASVFGLQQSIIGLDTEKLVDQKSQKVFLFFNSIIPINEKEST